MTPDPAETVSRETARSGPFDLTALMHPAPTDGVISFRVWDHADIPAVTRGGRDADTQRWTLAPRDYSDDDARAFIDQAADRLASGLGAEVAVVSAGALDHVLGSISLVELNPGARTGEVGYWITPDSRRQGIATRAARLMAETGIARLGLSRIYLRTMDGNIASEAVARAAGFTFQGIERSVPTEKRGAVDLNVHVLPASAI